MAENLSAPGTLHVRQGPVASVLRAIPGVHQLARAIDDKIVLPFALRRAGWHFGPHYSRVGKRKLLGMLNATFEGETLAVFRRIVPKGAVALDVGANFGYFTRHFSDLVGSDGKVFAFEAHPDVYACMRQNVAGRANVKTHNVAVSDKDGELELQSMDNPLAHSLFATGAATGNWSVERRIKVPAVRIDHVLADGNFGNVPLVVKMDIEGAEPIALAGMSGLLARFPDTAMIVEYAPACLDAAAVAPRLLLETLWADGFAIYPIEHPVSELRDPPSPGWHVNLLCVRGGFAQSGAAAGLVKLVEGDLEGS